jgi:ABC-type oligopeptide transport system substrate-binding subunit
MKLMSTLIVVLLCLTSLPLFGGGVPDVEQPSRPPLDPQNTFSIALLESDDTLFIDPIRATDANSLLIIDGLFEGLYSLDPKTAQPIPALARDVVVSEDGKTWTFRLKENLSYSNGDPITADSIISSWIHLLDLFREGGGNTYIISMMDCIKGVEDYRKGSSPASKIGISTSGPTTIRIELEHPAPYLPSLLSMKPLAAIHPSVHQPRDGFDYTSIVGSGPYVIESFSTSSVLLAKNPWYMDYDEIPSDHIRFTFMDKNGIVESYRNGDIHWALAFIGREVLKHPSDMHISPQYSTGFYYFSSDEGVYSNRRVRRALQLLIPWDELRSSSGQLFPTSQLVPWYTQKTIPGPTMPKDPEAEAFSILEEEGFPYGAGLPTLHMVVHRGAQVVKSAERIADIWSSKLGITVVIDSVPLSTYSRYPELSPYDFSFITWIGDFHDPFAFLHLFSGDSGYNLGKFHDSEYDALLERAMSADDGQKRTQFAMEAETYLLGTSTVFPMFHGFTTNTVRTDEVAGWYDNMLDIHPLKYLQIR